MRYSLLNKIILTFLMFFWVEFPAAAVYSVIFPHPRIWWSILNSKRSMIKTYQQNLSN